MPFGVLVIYEVNISSALDVQALGYSSEADRADPYSTEPLFRKETT